jgi:REP element-mobilizing transposase RayT
MSEYIHKSHNVSLLLYHYVCSAKYRKIIFNEAIDKTLKETCQEIEKRYEIKFLEIGTDRNHVHFLIQGVPTYSPTKIITMIKSITAKQIFMKHPEVKKQLWGGEFWGDGHYVSTVGKHSNEEVIAAYVRGQGQGSEYKPLHKQSLATQEQISLFD